MAVHGDMPRSMTPAIYCGFPRRNRFAYNVIKGGVITQFAIMVRRMGFGFPTVFLTSLKAMPTTVGYIMKNRPMPIGIDN